MKLVKEVKKLSSSEIKSVVDKKLNDFSSFMNKTNEEWFSELCFCILTSNSKAETAINIQNELGSKGFLNHSLSELRAAIRKNSHRFHNTKGSFIIEARKYMAIKNIIKSSENPREWLVSNVKGLGYKEASHFLRNVGYFNYAILDRHIINLMTDEGIIVKPKTLNKKNYLEIEKIFNIISSKLQMLPGELDLYMWYIKTGKILK